MKGRASVLRHQLSVVEVAAQTPLLADVYRLWRAESGTLGFMPEGGFMEACRRRELLAATLRGQLGGYVMFRRTRLGRVVIVHLCVCPEFRGQGVARFLLNELRSRARGFFDITLRCRRDFPVNAMWRKLGFSPVGETSGRGAKPATLTIWRLQLEELPLLAAIAEAEERKGVRIVVDANVFYDLSSTVEATESRGLLADWLPEVELCVTEELLAEIDRNDDAGERARQRERMARFPCLPRGPENVEQDAYRFVRARLPQDARPSIDSDARQIAMTVGAGVSLFVTRDADLVKLSGDLEDEFGVEILMPHEVINRFDELGREEAYRPRRLFLGSGARARSVRAADLDDIVDLLHRGERLDERRRDTAGKLRQILSQPDRYAFTVVQRDDSLLTVYVVDQENPEVLAIPYFGVAATRLGRTAALHYAEHLVALAVQHGRRAIVVERGAGVGEGLLHAGFIYEPKAGWVKLVLPVVTDGRGLATALNELCESCPVARPVAAQAVSSLRWEAPDTPPESDLRPGLMLAERALWPAKVTGTGLPCFVVPIQPRWAEQLFDRDLAQGTLFGADPHLVLNSENVYYRAAKPAVLKAPGRILWYVSKNRAYPGTMAVRATSYLEEVVIGPARDLFRRFRRLGVYQWTDVLNLAGGDPSGEVMAFRFTKSELFARPVEWDETQRVLSDHTGSGSQFQSPMAISEACFLDFYRRGQGVGHAA